MQINYHVVIEPDGKQFHGYVPALPGCHTWGKSVAAAKRGLQEAMSLYIESLIAHGDPIPQENRLQYIQRISVPSSRRSARSKTMVKKKRQYA